MLEGGQCFWEIVEYLLMGVDVILIRSGGNQRIADGFVDARIGRTRLDRILQFAKSGFYVTRR